MSEHQQDHYAILNISRDAEVEVIRAAYKALMIKHHPDHNPSDSAEKERKTKNINAAYHILRDPDRRAAYDLRFPEAHMEHGGTGYTHGAQRSNVDTTPDNFNDQERRRAAESGVTQARSSSGLLIGSMKSTAAWVSIWVVATTCLLVYRNDAHNLPPAGVSSTSTDVQPGAAPKDPPLSFGAISQPAAVASPEAAALQDGQPFANTSNGKLLKPLLSDIGKRYSPRLHDCLGGVANSVDALICLTAELRLQESLRDKLLASEGNGDGGSARNIYRLTDREIAECSQDQEAFSALICHLKALTETNYAQGARVNQTHDGTITAPAASDPVERGSAASADSLLTEGQPLR